MENAISNFSGRVKVTEREVIEVMNRISELSKRIMCIERIFYLEILPFLDKQYGNQWQANDCLDLVQPLLECYSEYSDACLPVDIEEQYDDNLQVINDSELSDIFGDTRLKADSPENSPDTSNLLPNEGSTLVTCGNYSGVNETGNPISQVSDEWSRTSAVLRKIAVNVDEKSPCKVEEISKDCVSSTSEICEVKENFLENKNIPIKVISSLQESGIVLNEHGLNPRAHSVVSCKTETEKLDKCGETDIFEGNCCNVSPQYLLDVPRERVSRHDLILENEEERSVDGSKNATLVIHDLMEANDDQTAITQDSHYMNETGDSKTQTAGIKNSHKHSGLAQDLSHRDSDSIPELVLSETSISDSPNRLVKCKNNSPFSKKRSKKSWTLSPISAIEAEPCLGAISPSLSPPRNRSSPRAASGSSGSSSQRLVTLLEAAADGNISQVRRLLSQGTPVDVKNENGDQPLHLASRNGHLPVMVILLRNGAPVNVANKSGDLPLHLAVERGHLSLVKLLVTKYGVDVNAKGANGRTALELAVAAVHEKIVKFLRENEAPGRLCEEKKIDGGSPVPWKKTSGCTIILSVICFAVFVILKFKIWPEL